MKRDFDVVVIGGAMAGAATAALLAADPRTATLRIALLEPKPATAIAPGEPLDLRVSALSHASRRLLERTGAWPRVQARGAAPYQRMVVWEERGSATGRDALCFDAAEAGEPDLGCIAENRTIQTALLDRARELGAVLLRAGLGSLEPGADAIRVLAQDGRAYSAALVVGADGGGSLVRTQSGIGILSRDYGQQAVVAHLRPEKNHEDTAWQRFLDSGPLALLPLADGRVSLVWSTLPELATELVACDASDFAARVTAASDRVLGTLELTTERAAFPLRLLHARRYAAQRVVLVGDAAHTVHPLAGQGINLAFLDAAALVDVVADALAAGDDPGEQPALRRYERWRKAEALPVIALLDALQRLFLGGAAAKSRLRRTGLGLVQAARPLKQLLIRRALNG